MIKNANIHREINFEEYITKKLQALENSGWRVSNNGTGFDPNTALVFSDFVEYVTATAPDKIEKLKKTYGSNWGSNLRLNKYDPPNLEGRSTKR